MHRQQVGDLRWLARVAGQEPRGASPPLARVGVNAAKRRDRQRAARGSAGRRVAGPASRRGLRSTSRRAPPSTSSTNAATCWLTAASSDAVIVPRTLSRASSSTTTCVSSAARTGNLRPLPRCAFLLRLLPVGSDQAVRYAAFFHKVYPQHEGIARNIPRRHVMRDPEPPAVSSRCARRRVPG